MNRGVKSLLAAASFAAASCAAGPDTVEVRAIKDPGSKLRQGADGLADARGQLAIGNTGLALEGFRKVARQYPDNAEAVAGMAAAYEAMGRYDLAETQYEAALALAPRNPAILMALAAVLDRLGRASDAAGVRGEVAQLAAAAAALDRTPADDEAQPAAMPAAQTVSAPLPSASVTVALPPPQLAAPAAVAVAGRAPAERLHSATELRAQEIAVREMPAADRVTAKLPAPRLAERAAVSLGSAPLAVRAPALDQRAALNADLSPELPAPRLGERAAVSLRAAPLPVRSERLAQHAQLAVDLSMEVPAPRLGERAAVNLNTAQAPRLERMSLGEVALLTGSGPVWRGQVVARTPQKLTVRWVPLATAAVARPRIRLLNAARWQGLAARNRSYLLDRGWRKIEVGDARQVRERSIVLYPAAHAAIGRRLAAHFGCQGRPVKGADQFLVLLGRDAALRPAKRRG